MEKMLEMEEHNFLEMVFLSLEERQELFGAYDKHDLSNLSDNLEVESQSATDVTIHHLGLELFEDTFENTQWRNKCSNCDYVYSYAGAVNRHLKTQARKSQMNATKYEGCAVTYVSLLLSTNNVEVVL